MRLTGFCLAIFVPVLLVTACQSRPAGPTPGASPTAQPVQRVGMGAPRVSSDECSRASGQIECPEGEHNDGDGECVPKYVCADGFALLDKGHCGQVFSAPPVPAFPWSHQQVRMTDGRIFVVGWHLRQRTERGSQALGPQLALSYKPSDNTWKRLADPPAARADAAMAAMSNGRVMVVGGMQRSSSGLETVSRVDIYDSAEDKWIRTASLPAPRSQAVAVGLSDGKVLVVGGQAGDEVEELDTLIYEPAQDKWRSIGTPNFALYDHLVQTFVLPDGDVLFVGGCAQASIGPARCPARRLDVGSGSWTEVSAESGGFSVAAKFPSGRIFLFNRGNTAAIYDPEAESEDDALVTRFRAGASPAMHTATHAFAIDEGRVALVAPPEKLWVVEFEFGEESFGAVDTMALRSGRFRTPPEPNAQLTPLGPGEAFAFLHAWDDGPAFIAAEPMAMRLAVSTDGVQGRERLEPSWRPPVAFTPLPVTAALPVENIDEGPPRTGEVGTMLDWIAAAWGDGKKADWIGEQLAFPANGARFEPDDIDDGKVRAHHRMADLDGDGKEDLAVHLYIGCMGGRLRMSCKSVSALIPASGGWAVVGIAEQGDYPEMPYEFTDPVDFTGDGVPELVVEQVIRANHNDWKLIGVFSVDGASALRPVLAGSKYPGSWQSPRGGAFMRALSVDVKAPDGERAYIEVADGAAGSAGAGAFQRATLHRWEWNSKTMLIEPVPPEKGGKRGHDGNRVTDPNLRIHHFGDALYALDAQEIDRARRHFEEVISGGKVQDTFSDWQNTADGSELRDKARAQLRQYAFFMLARLAIERSDSKRLVKVKGRLTKAFPKSPMLAAIDELDAAYQKTGNMSLACAQNTPKYYDAFGEDWAFRQAFGDYAPVKFGPGFSRRHLCSGLDAPPKASGRAHTEMLEPGYLRVEFHLDDPDDEEAELVAKSCASRFDACDDDSCADATLVSPTKSPFAIVADREAPRSEVVWKVDCDEIHPKRGAKLCLIPKQGGEAALEVEVRGKKICGER